MVDQKQDITTCTTYAVTSLQEGDDIKTVQSNLGHATASFTMDVYGHVSQKMKSESAAEWSVYSQFEELKLLRL